MATKADYTTLKARVEATKRALVDELELKEFKRYFKALHALVKKCKEYEEGTSESSQGSRIKAQVNLLENSAEKAINNIMSKYSITYKDKLNKLVAEIQALEKEEPQKVISDIDNFIRDQVKIIREVFTNEPLLKK